MIRTDIINLIINKIVTEKYLETAEELLSKVLDENEKNELKSNRND